MNFYSSAIDIIIVIVTIAVIYSSAKQGFLKTLVFTIGLIISAFIAIALSKFVSQWIYDSFIKANIIKSISDAIISAAPNISANSLTTVLFAAIPAFLSSNLSVSKSIEQLVSGSSNLAPEKIVESVETTIISPIIISLISIICFIVILLICIFIAKRIAKVTTCVNRIPVIGFFNSLFGGILGFVKAGVMVFLLVFSINILITVTSNSLDFINNNVIESTYIFKWIYHIMF